MDLKSVKLLKDDKNIIEKYNYNAYNNQRIRKLIEKEFKNGKNNEILIKLIALQYYNLVVTEEQITFILHDYFNKYSKLNRNNLEQIVLDIGIILKIPNGINKIKELYPENGKITLFSMNCEYDELYKETFDSNLNKNLFKLL
jgi:hypothetical protein